MGISKYLCDSSLIDFSTRYLFDYSYNQNNFTATKLFSFIILYDITKSFYRLDVFVENYLSLRK